MKAPSLRLSPSGHAVVLPGDDPDALVDALIDSGYSEEFCLSPSFDPVFVASLMAAGFLVMSFRPEAGTSASSAILLPKLHQERSVLDLDSIHEARSARRVLRRYRLGANEAFREVVDRCIGVHGDDWLTGPLCAVFQGIRDYPPTGLIRGERGGSLSLRMLSFALYREERLVAGEFGTAIGGVYTSYSGFREESSAGTAQMLLAGRYLREAGFDFWDLGMPMEYKDALGARTVPRAEFIDRYRAVRGRFPQPIPSATIRA